MTRLSIVLLAALMVSAMYLVRVQYDSRRLFTELDRAAAEAHRLETERGRLEVEKRAAATSLRVETLAKDAALAAGLARNGRLLAARMFDPEANNDRLARIFTNNYRCWKETCVE